MKYTTFLGDAAFDNYDIYRGMLAKLGFTKAVIPMNHRNDAAKHNAPPDENGIPICPHDGTQLKYQGACGVKKRSKRLKFLCPKSVLVKTDTGCAMRCMREDPCTPSEYGHCVYIYPDADKRLYPGILQNSPEWLSYTPDGLLLNALLALSSTFLAWSRERHQML